jgi:F-type H+-transporting ATPase subunit alpha
VIYGGTRGYLDKVATADVGRWERELLGFLHGKHQDVLDDIRTKKDLGPVEDRLKAALATFSETFA